MSTTKTALSDQWIALGTGPLMAEAPALSNIALHFGDTAPTATETAFHTLLGPTALTYEGRQTCYAKALNDNASVIYTVGA